MASPRVVDVRHFLYGPWAGPSEPFGNLGKTCLGAIRAHLARGLSTPSNSDFQNHVVLIWSEEGHTYGVGFHGLGPRVIALDRAVARSIMLVEPNGEAMIPARLSGSPGSATCM